MRRSLARAYAKTSAAVFDWALRRADRAGAADHRERLCATASGRVLEIGAGSGLNFPWYRRGADVVALEPYGPFLAMAARRAPLAAVPIRIVRGDAQRLPFAEESFDTVVCGLVLCSIRNPARALEEFRRVLAPRGTLRFYEHVRAEDPKRSAWQDRFERPWGCFTGGCHPNRPTAQTIEAAGFRVAEIERFDFDAVPRIVRPHVSGWAVRGE